MNTRIAALFPFFMVTTMAMAAEPLNFKVQEIAKDLKIGYAVHVCDVNADGKPDIVVVDQFRVVWYENPTWKMRVITEGKAKGDNVTLAYHDIDGDGQLDFVLGAGWKPTDTKTPGTLQWLKRGKTLDEEWTMYPIPCEEPTVHRIRMATIDGKPHLINAPLQGRDCTAKGGWMDGRPVRIMAYPIPKEPTKPESWKPFPICEDLHVIHNFWPVKRAEEDMNNFWVVSYEGVYLVWKKGDVWTKFKAGTGNQDNPMGSRGASEIRVGKLKKGAVLGTVEPWHGNQIVVYTEEVDLKTEMMKRVVVDKELRWGHAIAFADLDGDGKDELIAGVRDNPDPKANDTFKLKCGVRIYKNTDSKGETWERMLLDEGGVAVEDLTVADLDGDGRMDIIAVGRATKNCKIYWNKPK